MAFGTIGLGESPRTTPGDVIELPSCLSKDFCSFEGRSGVGYFAQSGKSASTGNEDRSQSNSLTVVMKLIHVPTFAGQVPPFELTVDDDAEGVLRKLSRDGDFTVRARVMQNGDLELRSAACYVNDRNINFRMSFLFDDHGKLDHVVLGSIEAFDDLDRLYSAFLR